MAFISSPIQYPPTSSPREEVSPRKRRKIGNGREPLRSIENGAKASTPTVAGFLVDDCDDENDRFVGEDCLLDEPSSPRVVGSLRSRDDCRGQRPAPYSSTASRESPNTEEPNEARCDHDTENLESQSRITGSSIRAKLLSPSRTILRARTCRGNILHLFERVQRPEQHYERMIASRSSTVPDRAQKSYYGIDIHHLVDEANTELRTRDENPNPLIASEEDTSGLSTAITSKKSRRNLLWTEKYRPRKFTDLVGDERTHRSVLRWLKSWDHIVFPHQSRLRARATTASDAQDGQRHHRKVLMLAGPPGLGKTTMAHVCARQAGYETQEINASDERSKEVVKGPIRDMVGTENVQSLNGVPSGKSRKPARPICVIVDEMDGVVTGSGGGGEGGFVKALVDLLALDQKNTNAVSVQDGPVNTKRKKGDKFRLLRPLILICNDLYHPSLRLLRQGFVAEIIHVRKPPLTMVVPRMQAIFEREDVPCDSDGVRRLCEAAWGISSHREGRKRSGGTSEGDIRGILVVGEWVARKLRTDRLSSPGGPARMSKQWLEKDVLGDLAHGGGAARGLGRGGSREVVERLFLHNAGFASPRPFTEREKKELYSSDQKPLGVAEAGKKHAMDRLREMIDGSGENERIITDIFTSYPSRSYQDDTAFTKPTTAHDWLYFHELMAHRVHTSQDWELSHYLSYPILAMHSLFSSANAFPQSTSDSEQPEDQFAFASLSAARASDLSRANGEALTSLQQMLTLPLQRSFRSVGIIAAELVPYVLRLLSPDVKPTLIAGVASVRRAPEKERVLRAVDAMCAVGVKFERGRVELNTADDGEAETGRNLQAVNSALRTTAGWIYRMEPPLDDLGLFASASPCATSSGGDAGKVRYAVRQVLEQEWRKETTRRETDARMKRAHGLPEIMDEGEANKGTPGKGFEHPNDAAVALTYKPKAVKRDFFGRPIAPSKKLMRLPSAGCGDAMRGDKADGEGSVPEAGVRVWVTHNEGYSNAVKKPITLKELLEGL